MIAADDFADVNVNGMSAGSVGSISDSSQASMAQSSLTQFDLTPFLVAGTNTINILGRNGPQSFGGCTMPCDYEQNPAGVVFDGKLECN